MGNFAQNLLLEVLWKRAKACDAGCDVVRGTPPNRDGRAFVSVMGVIRCEVAPPAQQCAKIESLAKWPAATSISNVRLGTRPLTLAAPVKFATAPSGPEFVAPSTAASGTLQGQLSDNA